MVNSGLLLMAVMGILLPAVLHFTHTEVHFGKSELALSRFSSCVMLVAYASYLFFQLRSQHKFNDSADDGPVEVSSLPESHLMIWHAIILMCKVMVAAHFLFYLASWVSPLIH